MSRHAPMIVSVHIPKCAGTSFHHVLRAVYGERLWLNYGEAFVRAQALRAPVPATAACIHGHFLADTFRDVFPAARIVTWVRDPVERVASNYHHFLRSPDMRDDCCRQLHAERLSLLEFAELDWMRNTMTRYLAGTRLEDFAAVGVAEHFEESVGLFGAVLGWPGPLPAVPVCNVNPTRQARGYALDAAERSRIATLNEADHLLYRQALARLRAGVPSLRSAA